MNFLRALATLLSAALLATSCTSLPTDYPKPCSTAFKSPASTEIGGMFEREAAKHPGKSGFAIIPDNRAAFTDRVALADFAEKTLDIQYYIWSADTIGRMLGERILKAAERGVRVRFLLDDFSFKNRDSAVAALAAHPNVEVRIFNPYQHRSARVLEMGLNFGRLNKRMHNKIMVMDNAAVIVGGRNIADEYFGISDHYNNRDLDIVAVGPIVRDVSNTFDEFWNSPAAIPISALVKETYDLADFHRQMVTLRQEIAEGNYPYPLDSDVQELKARLHTVSDNLVWAKGEVLHDSFDSMKKRDLGVTVAGQLGREVESCRKELFIESAYFVVKDSGIEFIRNLTSRGVKVRVLTNSLASNNVIAAQSGHSKNRKKLIRADMELYELRPDAASVLAGVAPQGKNSITTLHTKALVIDADRAFVGSYNLDPRSAEINSEIGILVHSPVFAGKVRDYLNQGVEPGNAYHVTLDSRNTLQWKTIVDGQPETWKKDPHTSAFKRFKSAAIGLLPIHNQL